MYESIHAQIRKNMDAWLVTTVPYTIEQGVEHTRTQLHHEVKDITGDASLTVNVWRSFDEPHLLRFEYIYMDGPKPVFGWYLLDARFWDNRDSTIPAIMDSELS